MQISIIIPTLNEARGICTTLQALQSARSSGLQIVLSDGGSTDDTVLIARSLVDRVVDSKPGRAAQMNSGAAQATGEVLWFLHADTMLQPNSVAALCQAVKDQLEPEFWGRFDIQLDATDWIYRIIETLMNWRSRLTSVTTGDQGLFVSRQLHMRLGGFSSQPLMEDIEYSKRLRGVCKPINLSAIIITSARRWKQKGVIRTIVLMWWLRLAYVCGVSPEKLAQWYR